VSVPFQFTRKSAFTKLGDRIVQSIETRVAARSPQLLETGRGGPAIHPNEFSVHVSEQFPPSFAPGASDVYGRTPDPAGIHTHNLPIAPHPLNPAKMVYVRTVRPFRPSAFRRGVVFP
jgi:hypothetical protein